VLVEAKVVTDDVNFRARTIAYAAAHGIDLLTASNRLRELDAAAGPQPVASPPDWPWSEPEPKPIPRPEPAWANPAAPNAEEFERYTFNTPVLRASVYWQRVMTQHMTRMLACQPELRAIPEAQVRLLINALSGIVAEHDQLD
jgi:hypothetical protein